MGTKNHDAGQRQRDRMVDAGYDPDLTASDAVEDDDDLDDLGRWRTWAGLHVGPKRRSSDLREALDARLTTPSDSHESATAVCEFPVVLQGLGSYGDEQSIYESFAAAVAAGPRLYPRGFKIVPWEPTNKQGVPMSQAEMFGARTAPPPEAVRSRFDVDCTPSPVALQCVRAVTDGWLRPASEEHAGDAPRVLDLCAGSGSWSRAVRVLFPKAVITALEAREDERSALERWADLVLIGDVARFVDVQSAGYDLIVGNPPFSLVDARKPPRKGQPGKSRLRAFEVLVVAARRLLAPTGRLALYVPAAWWQRGGDVAALAQEHPPIRQLNVPLPVSHRGAGQQAATDAYAVYVWPRAAATNGEWITRDLPILPAADRRWREVPGTEA